MTSPFMLGSFEFRNLHGLSLPGGAPETVRQTAMPIQRPGVPGTGFIVQGIKAVNAFQMRSFTDLDSISEAQVEIEAYRAACNAGLLSIVHAGTDYSATPVFNQYWVMDVAAAWRRVSASTGGLYVVEAIWTLMPVFVQVAP